MFLILLLLVVSSGVVWAEVESLSDLAVAVESVQDGRCQFRYETRDGVVGNYDGVSFRLNGNTQISFHHGHFDETDQMKRGPAHVFLTVRDGRVKHATVKVGVGPPAHNKSDGVQDDPLDFGTVPSAVAADFLLALSHTLGEDDAEKAQMAAVFARDGQVVSPLLETARDQVLSDELRQGALFWLAVLAGHKVIDPIKDLLADEDESIDVRESALFALTHLHDEEALPVLMDVATHHAIPQLRQAAFFWLADYDVPEVADLFESVLLGN